MGGHGAISFAIRRPDLFASVSAFSPICHPIACPWGRKAFTGYLGTDEETWKKYDSALLIASYTGPRRVILVDVGSADPFLVQGQLQPESLKSTDHVEVKLRHQKLFDHSYYFIGQTIHVYFNHLFQLRSSSPISSTTRPSWANRRGVAAPFSLSMWQR